METLIRHELTDNTDPALAVKISLYGSVTASYSFFVWAVEAFSIAYSRGIEIKNCVLGRSEHAIAHILDGKETLPMRLGHNLPRVWPFKPIAHSPCCLSPPWSSKYLTCRIVFLWLPQEWAVFRWLVFESRCVEKPRRRSGFVCMALRQKSCSGDG